MAGTNSRIIIFEGREGTGKTTLAKMLSDLTGWPMIHSGSIPGAHNDWGDDSIILEVLRATEGNVILDRSIISGWIYSQLPADGGAFRRLTKRVQVYHLMASEETRRLRDPRTSTPEPENFDSRVASICRKVGVSRSILDAERPVAELIEMICE